MTAPVLLSKLQADIHIALQGWHNLSVETSPLDYLQLFQQAQTRENGNARQVTNKILLEALEILAVKHKAEADLLRRRFLDGDMMHTVANRLNIGESTAYRKQQEALKQLALVVQAQEERVSAVYQVQLEKRLRLPPETQLFGVEAQLNSLQTVLLSPEPIWLVSIEGLGGIGKTALANALIRRPDLAGRFHGIAWVSAKQHEFLSSLDLEQITQPALTAETLTDLLLEQLVADAADLPSLPQQKQAILNRRLKDAPYLVVIDNLETVVDYQALLPALRRWANPGKFLLTSRHSLRAQANVFCCSLVELNEQETLRFIRHEAAMRGLSMLAQAPETDLKRIYGVVGGNPLAIKLVVGQISVLPLSQVLANLRQARGQKIEALYTYIYWQAWQMLQPASQQTLLVMPLTQEATLEQLLTISQLELDALSQALEQLVALSLVQVSGDLEARRYTIHRLTETFLLQEAVKWQTSL